MFPVSSVLGGIYFIAGIHFRNRVGRICRLLIYSRIPEQGRSEALTESFDFDKIAILPFYLQ